MAGERAAGGGVGGAGGAPFASGQPQDHEFDRDTRFNAPALGRAAVNFNVCTLNDIIASSGLQMHMDHDIRREKHQVTLFIRFHTFYSHLAASL